MQPWPQLREQVLDHITELQAQLPAAVARGDGASASSLARDLEGATMAVGLEEAARLAAGLVPLLALPSTRPDDVARLLAQVRRAVAGATRPAGGLPILGARILVVDDDAVTRKVLRHILEQAGCETVVVGDLGEARQALRNPFQAIVLDLHLPDGQGTALARELRDHPRLRLLPVLLLTGDADEVALREAYAAGADDFLVKPVRADDLVLRLGLLLREAGLRALALRHPERPA